MQLLAVSLLLWFSETEAGCSWQDTAAQGTIREAWERQLDLLLVLWPHSLSHTNTHTPSKVSCGFAAVTSKWTFRNGKIKTVAFIYYIIIGKSCTIVSKSDFRWINCGIGLYIHKMQTNVTAKKQWQWKEAAEFMTLPNCTGNYEMMKRTACFICDNYIVTYI